MAYQNTAASGHHITTNYSSNLTGTNIGSFSFWAYKDSANGNGAMIQVGNVDGSVSDFAVYSQNSDTTKLAIGFGGVSEDTSSTGLLSTGVWFNVVIAKGTTNTRVYHNGVQVINTATNHFNNSNLNLGVFSTSFYFDGKLSDVRAYENVELSASDAMAIYNNRGNDNIVNGLKLRALFLEKSVGQTVTAPVDLYGNTLTPNASPTYVSSPLRILKKGV